MFNLKVPARRQHREAQRAGEVEGGRQKGPTPVGSVASREKSQRPGILGMKYHELDLVICSNVH